MCVLCRPATHWGVPYPSVDRHLLRGDEEWKAVRGDLPREDKEGAEPTRGG